MERAFEKFKKAQDELVELVMKKSIETGSFDDLDEDTIKALALSSKFLKAANEYNFKMAETLDRIDEKLNRINDKLIAKGL